MNLQEYLNLEYNKKLDYFFETLLITNRTPEYFINWKKVKSNVKKYELELNILNYLIGKDNIYEEAKKIFTKYPETIKLIPILLAIRDSKIDLLIINDEKKEIMNLNFNNIDLNKIDTYLDFAYKSGLLNFLKNNISQSLVDFVYGIETGIDTNGRKNRSGIIMESLIKIEISKVCKKLGFEQKSQATPKYIFENWGIYIPVDKTERRFDEAIYDKENNRIWLIETNFYGSGGSKLKSVSGEFTELNNLLKTSNNINFIWITDGIGWKSAKLPFSEAFEKITYVFNINMLSNNYLYDLFIKLI